MAQTAIEWLMETQTAQTGMLFGSDIEKAKEMEKQQIIEAYETGDKYKLEVSGEQYYKEKFKNKQDMSYFEKFRRKQIAELRTVTQEDVKEFKERNLLSAHETKDNIIEVSISDVDLLNGSPKIGDMIARNPKNHLDQWLVAEKYFNDNFEEFKNQ